MINAFLTMPEPANGYTVLFYLDPLFRFPANRALANRVNATYHFNRNRPK